MKTLVIILAAILYPAIVFCLITLVLFGLKKVFKRLEQESLYKDIP